MKKIKKGGKENEAASFYTADEFFLRKGYQIPDLVTEVKRSIRFGIQPWPGAGVLWILE